MTLRFRLAALFTALAANQHNCVFDIRSAQFIRELIKFGFEVSKVNPTVTTTGETVISEFINTLLRGGDGRKAQGGLNQFFDGVKTPSDRMKLLGFADRLVQAAQLLQGADLQVQKKDARFLSQLLNLGGAYAALGTQVSQSDLHFFLETLRQSQNIQKAATELKAFLDSFNGDDKQLLAGSRNLLQALSLVPSQSIQSNSRNPSVAKEWLDEAAFHASLNLSLSSGESIFDPSGLYDQIWNASSAQQIPALAKALYVYAAEDVQVASNGNPVLVAQSDVWGNSNPIGGTITLISGAIYLIVDSAGKIIRAVYHSNSREDERTAEEKATDDAINEILVGATPTDRKGKPLPNGTNRKEGDVENYDKPTGEEGQAEDLGKLSRKAGGPIETTKDSAGNDVKSTKLIDGGSASSYSEAKSTGGATNQINTRPKSNPTRRKIKIRYTRNRKATIIIPTA